MHTKGKLPPDTIAKAMMVYDTFVFFASNNKADEIYCSLNDAIQACINQDSESGLYNTPVAVLSNLQYLLIQNSDLLREHSL